MRVHGQKQSCPAGKKGEPVRSPWRGILRSLSNPNYRIWAAGSLISNIGTWMQRTAQDWLVLTVLTHNNATAVGIVTGLQFAPQILLLPFTGSAADRFDRRKLMFFTQGALGLLALGLGLLTVTGLVQLWQVYVFALLLGCATAFDIPARQSFVTELVSDTYLSNAVALNSTSFNLGRMLGPAIAGVLITAIGTGWVFLLNAVSYVAVLGALAALRVALLHRDGLRRRGPGGFTEGLRYARGRPDLIVVLMMLALIGTFGVHFPVFISTMTVSVFHAGAGEYGALASMMALGSVTGALLAARREAPTPGLLIGAAAAFGIGLGLAAMMPSYTLFSLVLIFIGLCSQTFTTSANSAIQLWSEASLRGRMSALMMAVALGGAPLGAPTIGWVADTFGPRWGLAVGATSGLLSALTGLAGFAWWRRRRASRPQKNVIEATR